jgi:hypothetical protein
VKLDKLLKELNLPSEIYNISKWFNYEWLKTEFDNIIKTKTDKDSWESQTKWKQFEVFLENLFNEIDWLEVTKINQAEDEQIDLVIKNNIDKPFWLNFKSPVIIWEAKNHSTNMWTRDIKSFITTLRSHNNLSKIWFFISMKWFAKTTDTTIKVEWPTDKIIVKISWDDIKILLENELNPLDWLEWLVMRSFV